jgi:hypothetical protein
MSEFELEIDQLEDIKMENELLQVFADNYLDKAIRIVRTKQISQLDEEMVYEGMCILVSLYMNKVRKGEMNTDKVLH